MKLLPLLIGFVLAAQETTFRTTVPVVIVPATVTDARGRYIDGLDAPDFVILDDGRPQKFQMDTADIVTTPLAVVVAVQANNTAPAALLRIRKVGSMIEPLITGEHGHAAVITYGSEIRTVQEFTSDPDKLTKAFRSIATQSGNKAAMVDAVAEGVRLLAERPANERRVVFLIGESKDRGSKTKLGDVVKAVQAQGVSVFPVVFSAYLTPFLTKPGELPPSEGGGLITAIVELVRLGKVDATQALASYSGGRKTSFKTQRALEQVITSLGEELHSQYILSYTNPACSAGSHRIEVRVPGHPEARVRARYAYWTDTDACRDARP